MKHLKARAAERGHLFRRPVRDEWLRQGCRLRGQTIFGHRSGLDSARRAINRALPTRRRERSYCLFDLLDCVQADVNLYRFQDS